MLEVQEVKFSERLVNSPALVPAPQILKCCGLRHSHFFQPGAGAGGRVAPGFCGAFVMLPCDAGVGESHDAQLSP